MKIVRYGAPGLERPGLIAADESLRDLSDHLHDIVPELLAPERIAKLAETDPLRLPKVPGSPRLGYPVAGVGKIVLIGLNYRDTPQNPGCRCRKGRLCSSRRPRP
jgi:2,4-diketo-3-deoxy-L-fuconate hydrolase